MDPITILMLVRLAAELLPVIIKALKYIAPLMIQFFEGLNHQEQTQLRQAWATVWSL
jgi:hypothetical protein